LLIVSAPRSSDVWVGVTNIQTDWQRQRQRQKDRQRPRQTEGHR